MIAFSLNEVCTSLQRVDSLGEFTEQVRQIRRDWVVPEDKELWFRGERRDYGPTRLRPILYRPPRPRGTLKPVGDLLNIEDALFQIFQRCNMQLTDTAIDDDFDGYSLM